VLRNPIQGLHVTVSGGRIVIRGSGGVRLGLNSLTVARSLTFARPARLGAATAARNQVVLASPGVSEWLANGPWGLEQGFTLTHRPSGGGPLTPAFVGFSAAPLVTTAQATWDINPEGDSLASYAVACSSSAGNANAGGRISAGVLPADEASHPFTVALASLASGATYTCTLSLTDADGLTFSDSPRTVVTGTVSVPSTTVSAGRFIAVWAAAVVRAEPCARAMART
jgi:hypothetical protein